MRNVSCIIPAYNEAARIETVLRAATGSAFVQEIIVIDDCSTDTTKAVVEKFPQVRLIPHAYNQGKSRSVYDGVKNAHGELILLLDADLARLTSADIDQLAEPVITKKADVSISLRANAPFLWRWIGIDYISGERVFPRSLLDTHLEEIKTLSGFSLEVFLNTLLIAKKSRIVVVPWQEVESPYKYRKYGWLKGIQSDIKMFREIFQILSPSQAVKQIYTMRKSIVR